MVPGLAITGLRLHPVRARLARRAGSGMVEGLEGGGGAQQRPDAAMSAGAHAGGAAAAPASGAGGSPWCEREDLLASLYGFAHKPASELQALKDVTAFCGLLERFVASLVSEGVASLGAPRARCSPPCLPACLPQGTMLHGCHPVQKADDQEDGAAWTVGELDILREAVKMLTSADIMWHPSHGCALIAWTSRVKIQPDPTARHLVVVGLDGWEMTVHRWARAFPARTVRAAACCVIPWVLSLPPSAARTMAPSTTRPRAHPASACLSARCRQQSMTSSAACCRASGTRHVAHVCIAAHEPPSPLHTYVSETKHRNPHAGEGAARRQAKQRGRAVAGPPAHPRHGGGVGAASSGGHAGG